MFTRFYEGIGRLGVPLSQLPPSGRYQSAPLSKNRGIIAYTGVYFSVRTMTPENQPGGFWISSLQARR